MDARIARGAIPRRIASPSSAGVLLALTLVVRAMDMAVGSFPALDQIAISVVSLITAVVAWVVASRKPESPIGWLLGGAVLAAELAMLSQDFSQSGALPGQTSALVMFAAWVASWVGLLAIPSVLVLLLRFPNGELPSRAWRLVEVVSVMAPLGAVLATALAPGRFDANPSLQNPIGIEGAASLLDVVVGTAQALTTIVAFSAVASLFTRYRRSSEVDRQRLKWVAYATVLMVITLAFAMVAEETLNEASFFFALIGITSFPVSIGIAMVRYRLFDIDVLINRSLVYLALTTCVIGAYIAVVGSLTGFIGERVSLVASLVATGVVAVLVQPVKEGLQRFVDRRMFGSRDNPYEVLSGLGRRLEETATPDSVLPGVVADIGTSLRLSYVAVRLHGMGAVSEAASWGEPRGPLRDFPLLHHGEEVGVLVASVRAGETEWSDKDVKLLTDLARQVGPAAYAVRLATELKRSRASIVRAREEERRRLRRDIHDGLGPELAGISMKLGAAQRAGSGDAELVAAVRAADFQLQHAIGDLRSIVAGLVPPELERLGLVAAIGEKIEDFSSESGVSIELVAEAPSSIPPAVEVAAYRITLEALTNALKHSGCKRCVVSVAVEAEALVVRVNDDGQGLRPPVRHGTGLVSMRERAEEIGGSLNLDGGVGGTTVTAKLPLEVG